MSQRWNAVPTPLPVSWRSLPTTAPPSTTTAGVPTTGACSPQAADTPHVHCANLAVRLDALDGVGGFGHQRRAEDIDLWQRLRRAGFSVRADSTSVVTTSARLDGRVSGGFATALASAYRPVTAADHPDRVGT